MSDPKLKESNSVIDDEVREVLRVSKNSDDESSRSFREFLERVIQSEEIDNGTSRINFITMKLSTRITQTSLNFTQEFEEYNAIEDIKERKLMISKKGDNVEFLNMKNIKSERMDDDGCDESSLFCGLSKNFASIKCAVL